MQSNITQEACADSRRCGALAACFARVRAMCGCFSAVSLIASSKRAKLVREAEVLPAYYFPKEDVRTDLFSASAQQADCPIKGAASYLVYRRRRQVG